MSRSQYMRLPDAVIASGQTESNEVDISAGGEGVMIIAPAGAEATTIQVAPKKGGTYAALQLGDTPADAAGPAAGKARVYYELAFAGSFKLVAGGAVGATRTFKVQTIGY